jgi:hypothetical protein
MSRLRLSTTTITITITGEMVPSNTQEIDRISKVGQQSGGNINEYDYFAAFLFENMSP